MNTEFLSRVRRLGTIFTSDEVTNENHCRIGSWAIKIGIYGNPYIILFLTWYFMPWPSTQTHQNNHRWLFRHFRQGRYFFTWHSDVTTVPATVDIWPPDIHGLACKKMLLWYGVLSWHSPLPSYHWTNPCMFYRLSINLNCVRGTYVHSVSRVNFFISICWATF